MKKLAPGILIFCLIVGVFFVSRDWFARYSLNKGMPVLATSLAYKDTELLMIIGNHFFGGNEYDLAKAEVAFRKATDMQTGILWGHYQLARIYFIQGKFEEALEEIEKELKYNPENLRSLYVRALIYAYREKAGDSENAENDFRRFTQWAPSEWAGYNDLAWLEARQKKYENAVSTIEKAFANAPDAKNNPWLWNTRGVALLNLKKKQEAADSFDRALVLAEKLSETEFGRAYPGNDPQTYKEALKEFISSIRSNQQRANK